MSKEPRMIRRAPNLVFEGRKPDPLERVRLALANLPAWVVDVERRLAALEREAAVNGNGERG